MSTQLNPWNPFDELRSIQNRLSSFFGTDEGDDNRPAELALAKGDWSPAVDITEDEDEFLITADLPEVAKDDVKVAVRDGVLTISGHREKKVEEEDKKKKFHRVERSYGSYTRSFRLPDAVDPEGVDAKFDNGVLTVHLPKTEEPKSDAREIAVK
jgi:HSP20 family protein